MKTLKSLLYVLGATLLFAGCSDDDTVTVGLEDDPNCYGVYFPSQENIGALELDPADTPEAKFIARRNRDTDAITVPIVITGSEEGIFTATEIEFDEGQTETEFVVSFDGTEIGTTYTCEINIEDPLYASLYGERATGFSFSVTRVKWDLVTGPNGETKGKWRDDLFSSLFNLPGTPYAEKDIEIYERADQPGYYRIKDIYDAAYIYALFGGNYGGFTSTYTIVDATDPDKIYLPEQWTGRYVGSDGVLGFASQVPENRFNGDDYGKNENGVITFPARGVLVNFDADPESWYYGNGDGMLRIMLPGARAYDYALALSAGETVDGKVNIAVRFGADVASVKYAFYTGSTNDATVDVRGGEITDGEVASQELTAAGTIEAQFETTGAYSMVAVAYNAEGQASGSAYVNFGYVAAGDEEEQAVVMTVLTELTNEYAAMGYTSQNTMKAIMFGQNIQSGYYGLFKTTSVTGLSAAQLAQALPSAGDPFTAEELADINSTGYSTMYTGLTPGTSYTLLVLANNGYYTKLFAVEKSTDGDPGPLDITWTGDNIYAMNDKSEYFGTWNLWGRDYSDKIDGLPRTKICQITISENTENDEEDLDAINIDGMSLGYSANDRIYWEYYNGFILTLKQQPLGQFGTYYLGYRFSDHATGLGASTMDYMLCGGYADDGYVAFTVYPGYAANYNFDSYSVYAYSDVNLTSALGYLEWWYDLMLEDPAVATTSAAPAAAGTRQGEIHALTAAMSKPLTNYVELRDRARAHAVIDEIVADRAKAQGLQAAKNKVAVEGQRVSRPAAAQTTFQAGQFPQRSGSATEKIATKTLVVRNK